MVSSDDYTYEYDSEGNLTKRTLTYTGEHTEYTWDHRNRLVQITDYDTEGTPIKYVWNAYDADNELIRRWVWETGNIVQKTVFGHDSGQIVLQLDSDAYIGNLAAGDLSHRYLWGPTVDQLIVDEQVEDLFTTVDNETLWALTDHLGSVRDVVDSNGALRIHRRFDAYGNIVDETHYNGSGAAVTAGQAGFVDEVFAFTGRYFDADTGLQNNLHRWYDPRVGRWLSEDPIGFAAGDANLYRYVGNDPIGSVDPSGVFPSGAAVWVAGPAIPAAATGAAVVGGGVAVAGTAIVSYKAGEAVAPYTSVPLATWVVDTYYWFASDATEPLSERSAEDVRRAQEIQEEIDRLRDMVDEAVRSKAWARQEELQKEIARRYGEIKKLFE